jgi:hypothetical protein
MFLDIMFEGDRILANNLYYCDKLVDCRHIHFPRALSLSLSDRIELKVL